MKKWIFRLVFAFLALYAAAGIWLVPYLIRSQAPQIAGAVTQGGRLSIRSVAFNPFAFELSVRGVRFETPQGRLLFSLRHLNANADLIPLFTGKIGIKRITLAEPRLFIERDEKGVFNFDWLLHLPKKGEVEPADASEPAGLPPLALKHFVLSNGRVEFRDVSRARPLHLVIEPVGLDARNIDTTKKANRDDRLRFHAGTGGGMLDVRAQINSLQPPALAGTVDCQAGKLYLAWHFLQEVSTLEVADGRVQAHLAYDMNLSDLNRTRIDDLHLSLEQLRIKPKAENSDVLRLGHLQIEGGPIRPLEHDVRIKAVSVDDVFLALDRLEDGTLNWLHYFPRTAAEAPGEPEPVAAKDTTALNAVIEKVAFTDLKIDATDRTLPSPVTMTVEDFNLTLTELSSDTSKPITFTNRFSVNRQGIVEINGSVIPEPVKADVDLRIVQFALPPFSPYVEAQTFARLADGAVSMDGRIAYAPAAAAADMTMRGDFNLSDLLVNDTRNAMPLISMSMFEARDYLFELNPNRLFVDTATLDAFYADVVIDANATLNFATLQRAPLEAAETAKSNASDANVSKKGPFPMRLVRFIIRNGAVRFADYSLPLQFDTQVHDVNGQVLGLSTLPEDTTYLGVEGVIDLYGAANAEGSLNTGDPKAYTDIGVKFRNIDLGSFTPYSGKFLGRAIDRGKLSVSLRYNIVESQMKGDNAVVINSIELGESIESNESVSLPLDLAIALLEDSDGLIDIDMPVQGDVDNPEFKWGGVVWNAFVNLLTKVVTAPFDLIGSMLGMEGEALKYVEFEAGSALLDPPSREKLDALAKVLAKRPRLGLVITGTFDTAKDGKALRTAALLKEVLARTDKENIDASTALTPGLLEPIYLERFDAEALQTLKEGIRHEDESVRATLQNEALVQALIESQPLAPDALPSLAARRTSAMATYLNLQHGVDMARITIRDPKDTVAQKEYVPTELGVDAAE